MKISLIISFLLVFNLTVSAQKLDTVIVLNYKYDYLTNRNKALSMDLKGDTILILKKDNDKATDKAWDILNKKPYCKIYNCNSNLMETGIWFGEGFNGDYTSYYANGKIRSKGKFDYNNKVGKWYYYDKKGKVKEEEYK